MGSSASADDKSMRSQPDNKARSHSPATQKHTANESGEKDSLKNYRDVSNGDAKRKALNKTNKIHASNIQVEQSEGPMIALHNGTNEKLEIEQESANEIKKNRKKNQHQNDLDQAAMEEKYREEEAKRNARIGNLKDQLRRRVDEIRNTYDSVEVEFDTIQDLETDIKHLQKANNYGMYFLLVGHRMLMYSQTLVHPIIKKEDLYQEHVRAGGRKSQLLMKISELAGVRLKHNNPNIADLSDENRASKLSEKFGELYDNEYTDLFEIYCSKLPSDSEEKVVSDHMRECLEMKDDVDQDTIDSGILLRIKEFQKNIARFTIPSLQSSILSGITKEENLEPLLKLIKTKASGTNPYLRHYLDRCTELCWYTQIHDPPVALDFGVRNDVTDYRPYTKTGPVLDYMVWPVLLLHENGPMLSKGVAQFKGNEEGGENLKRLLSGRRRVERPNKREAKPFDYIPGDELREQYVSARVEVYETVPSSWD